MSAAIPATIREAISNQGTFSFRSFILARKRALLRHPPVVGSASFGEVANKCGSQPGHPFVMRAGQLDVTLRVLEGLVAQPLLQHRDRNTSQHAVAAVGVPEGVGVGPRRVDHPPRGPFLS